MGLVFAYDNRRKTTSTILAAYWDRDILTAESFLGSYLLVLMYVWDGEKKSNVCLVAATSVCMTEVKKS